MALYKCCIIIIIIIISYLFIAVAIKYALLKMAAKKGGVPEAEVVQKWQFISAQADLLEIYTVKEL